MSSTSCLSSPTYLELRTQRERERDLRGSVRGFERRPVGCGLVAGMTEAVTRRSRTRAEECLGSGRTSRAVREPIDPERRRQRVPPSSVVWLLRYRSIAAPTNITALGVWETYFSSLVSMVRRQQQQESFSFHRKEEETEATNEQQQQEQEQEQHYQQPHSPLVTPPSRRGTRIASQLEPNQLACNNNHYNNNNKKKKEQSSDSRNRIPFKWQQQQPPPSQPQQQRPRHRSCRDDDGDDAVPQDAAESSASSVVSSLVVVRWRKVVTAATMGMCCLLALATTLVTPHYHHRTLSSWSLGPLLSPSTTNITRNYPNERMPQEYWFVSSTRTVSLGIYNEPRAFQKELNDRVNFEKDTTPQQERHHHHRALHPGEDDKDDKNNNNDPHDEDHQAAYSAYNAHRSNNNGGSGSKRKKYKNYYTHISDLVFCLVMALGWMVWMLSSFVRSDFYKFSSDAVLIHGHVLQVSRIEDTLLTGMPTYRAVIDYMVPTRITAMNCASPLGVHYADDEEEAIQIRKQFVTTQPLESGFANVELLVLPQEPTRCVLKDDWEKEVQERADDECWKTPWFKRLSTTLALCLVLASITGGIQVVIRLQPAQRGIGWALICLGVPLLLPCAIAIHKILMYFQQSLDTTTQRGVIIRGASSTNTVPGTNATTTSTIAANVYEFCVVDAVDCCAQDVVSATTGGPHGTTPGTNQPSGTPGPWQHEFRSVKTSVSETAGCYFIRLQDNRLSRGRNKSQDQYDGIMMMGPHGVGRHSEGSLSTVSSLSSRAQSQGSNKSSNDALINPHQDYYLTGSAVGKDDPYANNYDASHPFVFTMLTPFSYPTDEEEDGVAATATGRSHAPSFARMSPLPTVASAAAATGRRSAVPFRDAYAPAISPTFTSVSAPNELAWRTLPESTALARSPATVPTSAQLMSLAPPPTRLVTAAANGTVHISTIESLDENSIRDLTIV